jgi:inner membrane protein
MENLAHTLFGITLAKAGLERATPLATTALVISSNIPDIDIVMRLRGGALGYIDYHRGSTHSFLGITLLAAVLTFILVYVDRRFRLRRDPFRRPVRPVRLLLISLLGGLGHLFMDYTNSYGVRPLLPFKAKWFYGDIAFVADPWIWLILGSCVVWLTAKNGPRIVVWFIIGIVLSFFMATLLRQPTADFHYTIPDQVRIIWFAGLALILAGALFRWGRGGEKVARYSLLLLVVYYSGLWIARGDAVDQARSVPPSRETGPVFAWPVPANPTVWTAVTTADGFIYTRDVNLLSPQGEWTERPMLEPRFVEALLQSDRARIFLNFVRYAAADTREHEGGYDITLTDIRFNLRLDARLDRDLAVQSVEVHWF